MLKTPFFYENIKREALSLSLLTKGIKNVENLKKNKAHSGLQDKTKEIKGSFRGAQVGKMLLGWEPN